VRNIPDWRDGRANQQLDVGFGVISNGIRKLIETLIDTEIQKIRSVESAPDGNEFSR